MNQLMKRYRPIVAAVMLGVCFFTSVLTFNDSLWKTTATDLTETLDAYSYVIVPPRDSRKENPLDNDLAATLRDLPQVQAVQPSVDTLGFVQRGTVTSPVRLRSVDWIRGDLEVSAGTVAPGPGEIVLDQSLAMSWDYAVGDSVTITANPTDRSSAAVTVSGIVSGSEGAVLGTSPVIYGSSGTLNGLLDKPQGSFSYIFVAAEPSRGTRDALRDVQTAGDRSPTIRSVDDFTAAKTRQAMHGSEYVALGMFAASSAAFLVLVLVIRAIFAVRIAQDRRDYSLRRCLGATRRQVFWSVVVSAAVTGVIGSVLGVALALGVAAAVFALPAVPLVFGISAANVILALIAGIVVCVLGALSAAKAAMRNSALNALRASDTPVEAGGLPPRALGIRCAALGVSLAVFFVTAHGGVLVGSIVSAALVAVLVLSLVQELVYRMGGPLARSGVARFSPSAMEAFERARTFSAQTSSVASLTTISVAFIALIGSGSSTLLASVDKMFTDVPMPEMSIAYNAQEVSEADILRAVESVGGVAAASTVEMSDVSVAEDPAGATIVRVTPELTEVVQVPQYLDYVGSGSVFMGEDHNVDDGQRVSLTGSGGTLDVTAAVDEAGSHLIFVSDADFTKLGAATRSQVWIDFAEQADVARTIAQLTSALAGEPVTYAGSAQQVVELESYLELLTVVALGLMAVGVLIALVGIASTLSISVISRTQEIGLQRALGATQADVRWAVLFETMFLTMLGAILGGLLGSVVGVGGVYSLTNQIQDMRFDVEWPATFFVVVLAATVAVGASGSMLAARRAVNIAPVQAITSA